MKTKLIFNNSHIIYDSGTVIDLKTQTKPKQYVKKGYVVVFIHEGHKWGFKRLDLLLAEAFISNPKKHKDVRHINGKNLDNTLSNLEWCPKLKKIKPPRLKPKVAFS